MVKPILVLIHGGFALASSLDKLSTLLKEQGYHCVVPTFPSVDASNPSTTHCLQDIQEIRQKTLLPPIETEGQDFVIFAHSYGGLIAAPAADGLSRPARAAAGLAGGVLGLIYLAGNVIQEGKSLLDTVGGQWPPYIKIDQPEPGFCMMEPVIETLFNNVEDGSKHAALVATVVLHHTSAVDTPSLRPLWLDAVDGGVLAGRVAFIRTLRDQVFPLPAQDAFLEGSGVRWEIVDIDAGHSAYVTQPSAVAKIVDRFASAWKMAAYKARVNVIVER